MTKSELIKRVAEKFPVLSVKDIEILVSAIFENMAKALGKGDRVEIRGFGSFKVKERRARIGRNLMTGESVQIPPTRFPSFKIGKELYDSINQEPI